ncbi:hypothetical protein VTN49DRAFT_4094 [Thermomyces lanuginosus]|uniref:uncharacterized protein n=1 Tax=Thermomyces lanuginosus TaxID=5541 RepID=UPI003743EAD0
MHFLRSVVRLGLLAAVAPYVAAVSWGFRDATVSIQSKAGTDNVDTSFEQDAPLSDAITLSSSGTLKLRLTTREGSRAKRPHQAFLLLRDPETSLDISYPFSVKDNGKAKLDLPAKELPVQFLTLSHPLDAEIVIGSFGDATAYRGRAFPLSVKHDPGVPLPSVEAERYGKLPEIHHIFKDDPKSPQLIVTLIFTLATLATLPLLLGSWVYLGANLNHLSTAFKSAPVPHVVFVGSIVGLEGLFFLYYTSWNLFQLLPAALALGVVAFLAGSRALSEVQDRRLAGLR